VLPRAGNVSDLKQFGYENPAQMRKRIALKYCGGCDPGYDRVKYFREIQNAAGDLIEWVSLDDRDFEAVLVITGCDTACPVENMVLTACRTIVSIRDNKRDPAEIVQSLLSEGKS
jgi:hypothetical protein